MSNLIDRSLPNCVKDTTICSHVVQCRPIPISLSIDAMNVLYGSINDLLYRYKVRFEQRQYDRYRKETIGDNDKWHMAVGRHLIKWKWKTDAVVRRSVSL
ncbi:MAG: hypothetical protein IPI30_22305 [Saprospiraceae bacterium]|nr:hypothetical protein [Candidatus Vicinibacter affinis]